MFILPNQEHIVELEQKYWQAMKDNDVETAISLTRFPCLVTGPAGTHKVSEQEYRRLMQGQDIEAIKGIKIENPEVEFLNDHTALISYSTGVKGMDMLDVSTWIREGDKWLCAFHSENPKKNDSRH